MTDYHQNTKEEAILEPKLVSEIKGRFFIPSYQRGYRWEPEHVKLLLQDIWDNQEKNYCLQPIVVKKISDDNYELIDGQQRTTTLFLIYKFIKQVLPYLEINFSLYYETREESETFLNNLDPEKSEDNIDFFHMYNAYTAIEEWFNDSEIGTISRIASKFSIFFDENVKVIWYEVNTRDDATSLFTRLNIGKIPLTNAELVKAQFLSKSNNEINLEKQLEISTSWDAIENDLRNRDFWSFLTNASTEQYPTRIELLFDLMSRKPADSREQYHTFFHFSEEIKTKSAFEVWKSIQEFYLVLKEWYQKRDIYHKVGYLVTIGKSLLDIIEDSKSLTKTEFKNSLDKQIKESLDISEDEVHELSYNNKKDRSKIDKLLLLFNVETVCSLQNSTEMYPFVSYKNKNWSLEHIHAQNSEGLNKNEDRKEWLLLHKKSISSIHFSEEKQGIANELIKEIEEAYQEIETHKRINEQTFEDLFIKVFELLSKSDDRSYIDSMSNMALLSVAGNAALNNATFDVKRNRILEMDKKGEYIPICTRRIFLKYYSDAADQQLHFWGEEDRKAYMDAMIGENGLLRKYLKPNSELV